MKAVICSAYGPPEVLQLKQVERPIPKENEVLIEVHAAAVTTAGLIGRTGKPFFTRLFSGLTKPKKPILGMEFSGKVVSKGKKVSFFEEGDELFGLTGTQLGAHAEFLCLPEDAAMIQKPKNLTFKEAAAIIEGGLTSFNFLKNIGKVNKGQKVLINGASGSVGTASVQLAKYLGAQVTGVSSTKNLDLVKSLGADNVLDYTQSDFTKNGERYDVIFDTVGKRSFPECKGSLESQGKYLDATGLGTVFHMMWTSLFSKKKAILSPTYVRSPQILKNELEDLKVLLEKEVLFPVIDTCFPLEQMIEAHTYVATGRKKGNVVFSIKKGHPTPKTSSNQKHSLLTSI